MRNRVPVVSAAGVALGLFALLSLALLSNSSSGGPPTRITPAAPNGLNPGPDVILGNISSLQQFGTAGSQVGLAIGTDTCNAGNVELDYFALPNVNHPVLAQNLYRVSGDAYSTRFEQIGQSWGAHGFCALQANGCNFGCTPASSCAHLGAGCSTADAASINAGPVNLGSRAWINPFTGVFPSGASNHTGHTHNSTAHRLLVESNDLNQTLNSGAAYYAEGQEITPHETTWCQTHPGECNLTNNVSYRRFNVVGITDFVFSPVSLTVRMAPAITAWEGATIRTIEPAPGVDGRAFLAYRVTGPADGGLYHYEYAIYNQNLDRGIQSFSVPMVIAPSVAEGADLASNVGFHAPPQHPGFANDGTQGDAGFSSAPWTYTQTFESGTWRSETFAQNPNANAIRWGTVYNFRFDSRNHPITSTATIGFFKTGSPITVEIIGPAPTGGIPTPTPAILPCASGVPFQENFDAQIAPTPPFAPGWRVSSDDPDTPPNALFCPEPAGITGPVYTIGNLFVHSSAAQVSFRNNFNTLFRIDGGVLEVSSPNISGGAFFDITNPAIGGSFISGAYNTTMAFVGNPLDGRAAWSGDSGGYIDTIVNLGPNVFGQTITLRWRFGTAVGASGDGWRIDTINSVGVCRPQQTPTPAPATHFAVVAPASVGYLTPFFLTVQALDQFNQPTTNYPGTVHFTTTAISAGLPPNSTLTEGFGTFSADLTTVGLHTITATDTVNPSITGTSNQILVLDDQLPTPTPTATPTPTPVCTPLPPTTTGFDDVSVLVSNGWFMQNNSQPGPGSTGWFQGNSAVFPAQSGPLNSYIGANFTNGTGQSTLSNWLLTPTMPLRNGMVMTFWTRTISNPTFPDRLQVRMSTNGSSSNVGSTATSVGDFTTLLLDINPIYTTTGYPTSWTQYSVTFSGLAPTTNARLAFRYFVENGGPGGPRSDYIGIDNVQIFAGCPGFFIPPPTPGPPTPTSVPVTPRPLPTTPTPSPACTPFGQGFDDITTLVPAGWFMQNNSEPGPGTTNWFQGNSAVFPAQGGSATSYIAANFNNGADFATLSNWLLTPPLPLQNGLVLTFWTRTVDSPSFPDRLQIRMSTNGSSVNVGTSSTDVGDFSRLLLDINPNYSLAGYPSVWTQFNVTLTGISAPTQGRLAFRYFVENAGPSGTNSDYIGIDTVQFGPLCGDPPPPTPTPTPTPTPSPDPTPTPFEECTQPAFFDIDVLGVTIVGTPVTFEVRAICPTGGIDSNYSGTVHFSSSDSAAQLPPDSGISHGFGSFTITFGTAGNQWIFVNDIKNPSISGESDTIHVAPSPSPTPSATPTPSVTPTPSTTSTPTPPTRALNVSTRLFVQTGNNAGIGGFIVTGNAPKLFLFRGIGPSLGGVGVENALADPTLDLRDSKGAQIQANNNWRDLQEEEIIQTGLPPTNDLEAAIVVQLDPGSYTVILRGANDTTGVGLVEIYDVDHGTNAKLGNLSTRAFVQTGNNVVIAGFILNGIGDDIVVVRGIGPSLTPLGVPDALPDPSLELRDSNGTLIIENNDWQDDQSQANFLTSSGLAPTNNLEAGLFSALPPGAYTAVLFGRNNGTGIGVVEIYDLGVATRR